MLNKEEIISAKINVFEDLYRYVYNILIEISNFNVEVWTFGLFGRSEYRYVDFSFCKVLKRANNQYKDYVKKYNEINVSNIKDEDVSKELCEKFYKVFEKKSKLDFMIKNLMEIFKSDYHYIQMGLFDGEMKYYAEETVDKARNTLKIVKEMI